MDSPNVPESKTTDSVPQRDDNSKRRFLKTMAVGSVGLASTHLSLSALGANCSISGMMSGNTSRQTDYECRAATGKSPGFWKTHIGSWANGVSYGGIRCDDKNKSDVKWMLYPAECAHLDNKGMLKKKVGKSRYSYTFDAMGEDPGHSMNNLAQALGADLTECSGTIMSYLNDGPGLERQMAAAMLSIAHPVIEFPYTAQEIVDGYRFAIKHGKQQQLEQILDNLHNDNFAADAPELVTHSTDSGYSCS